jgi:hypothetical protein
VGSGPGLIKLMTKIGICFFSAKHTELRAKIGEGKSGRLPKIDQNFNISFPATACPPTFHKTNVLHNDLKKDAINEFGIKY